MPASALEQIVSLAKRRGFVFPSSAIYGGLGSTWDYGPLGVELKNNVKRAWWRSVVHERDDMEGLDAAILSRRSVRGYRPDPVDAPAEGNLLICCSQPEGDIVIDL